MKKYMFFSFLITVLSLINCSNTKTDSTKQDLNEIYVASWNVENLFDTVDDIDKIDEWFLPTSEIKWTEKKLKQKIKNLAKVISGMNNKKGPDILSLEEVEHKSLVESLVKKIKSDKNYKIVHYESPDKRGIDNALIYNSDILSLKSSEALTVNLEGTTTRDILYAELNYNDEDIHIFVNHWSSRREGLKKTEPRRIKAAKTLLEKLNSLNAIEKKNIIIMGDFNDLPSNISISKILGARDFECDETFNRFSLLNLTYKNFQKDLGTYKYKKHWNMLDQMIISNSLLDKKGLEYVCDSFEIIKHEYVIQKFGKYKGTSLPTYGGRKYLGGYSDHFSIGAKFNFIK